MLAEAFPRSVRLTAMAAALAIGPSVVSSYQISRFMVLVSGEPVFIPDRVHFKAAASGGPVLWRTQGQMAQCLLTRSTDGFQRQKALRQMLSVNQPWSVPFVIALAGDYVVEIIDDILQAVPSLDRDVVRAFLVANPAFYCLVRARVASYWDCYYRRFPRDAYPGFKLLHELDAIVRGLPPDPLADRD